MGIRYNIFMMERNRVMEGGENMEDSLRRHLDRHYLHKGGSAGVKEVVVENNLLGQPTFRKVTFTDGSYRTLCEGATSGRWWTHPGGGRYGPRELYQGVVT
jgi:hypothetical protein